MIEITTAAAGDLHVLSDLIAEAFFDLPPSSWLIPNTAARRVIFPSYFRIYLENGLANGLVYTTADWAGAAVWLPVGTEPKAPPNGYHERLASVTAPWTDQFLAFDAALEARYPVGQMHHHLALLGVRPERQGRGIGTALLQRHDDFLDRQKLPAYLEASSRASRRLYLRQGYEDCGLPIQLPADGPSLFPMWRAPAGEDPAKRPEAASRDRATIDATVL